MEYIFNTMLTNEDIYIFYKEIELFNTNNICDNP